MNIILRLPEKIYKAFKAHLFSKEGEMAGFLFTCVSRKKSAMLFDFLDVELVQEHELANSGYYGIELGEEVWNRIKVKASKLNACIIEAHSHPFSEKNVGFSHYDMKGFEELVPHLWWRMNGTPYGALVFGQRDFDALFWTENPHDQKTLNCIMTDEGRKFKPTNITSRYYKRKRRWTKKDMQGKSFSLE